VYITSRGRQRLNVDLVGRVAGWVGAQLRMFGLGEGESTELGWGEARKEGEAGNVRPYTYIVRAQILTRKGSARRC
jgi:hypothetical protein